MDQGVGIDRGSGGTLGGGRQREKRWDISTSVNDKASKMGLGEDTSISDNDLNKNTPSKDYWLAYQIVPLPRKMGNNSDINNASGC